METRLGELRTKLLSAPDFLEEFERHLASRGFQPGKKKQLPVQFQIDANFDGAHPLLTDGAPAILMRTDRKWWKIFERRIESEMKSSAIIRIMLRDVVLDRVTILLASRSHYIRDKGWIDLLNDPSKAPKTLKELWDQFDSGQKLHTSFEGLSCVFPGNLHLASYDGRSGKINDDDVRFWRSILRKEDSKAQDWIARHGGEYHPCNWYIFKDDLNALSATRLRNACARSTPWSEQLTSCIGVSVKRQSNLSIQWLQNRTVLNIGEIGFVTRRLTLRNTGNGKSSNSM